MPAGWHVVGIFLFPTTGLGVVYAKLPSCSKNYQCISFFHVPSPLVFTFYSWLHISSGLDDVQQVITLPTSELVVWRPCIACYMPTRDFIGSLCFGHTASTMPFRLPPPLIAVLHQFIFFRIVKRMQINPVLAILLCHQAAEIK